MQPETICIASFKGMSSVFVCVLWHQTGAQYSAGANTNAVVEVCKVSNEVPQLAHQCHSGRHFLFVCANGFCMLDSDPG